MPATPSLLIVDDEAPVLAALERAIRRHYGDRLRLASSTDPRAALRWLVERDFSLVMSDLRMPGMDGISFLQQAGAIRPDSLRLMLTASADFESAQAAINRTAVFRYLCKPWRDEDLIAHLDAALAQVDSRRLQRQMLLRSLAGPCQGATAADMEKLRLEALEPGITQVDWGPHGEVLMPPLGDPSS